MNRSRIPSAAHPLPAHWLVALMALGLATLLHWPSEARAQARQWLNSGVYTEIVVSDCANCGDDVGFSMACQGAGQPGLALVPWLGSEREPAPTSPLSISIGSQRFDYQADALYMGQVGYVPRFFIDPRDPVIEALQAGSRAVFTYNGLQTTIGLRGSRQALSIFKAHCEWNNLGSLPNLPANDPVPQFVFDLFARAAAANTPRPAPQPQPQPQPQPVDRDTDTYACDTGQQLTVRITSDGGNVRVAYARYGNEAESALIELPSSLQGTASFSNGIQTLRIASGTAQYGGGGSTFAFCIAN